MKRTLSAILCAALCLVLALAGAAQADIVKPNDDFYCCDDANVMTDATRAMIYYNNVELQKACGAQIVVAAVQTLDGLTCGDYAYRLLNEWGVGDKTENNGVVLLLAIDEDDYYLTTGTGMERHLDAGAAKTMLDKYLEPDFAKKDYDAGIRKTFEAIFTRVNSVYRAGVTFKDASSWQTATAQTNPRETEAEKEAGSEAGFISIAAFILIIFMFLRVGSRGVRTRFGAWFWYGCVGGMRHSRNGWHARGSRSSSFGGRGGFGGGRGGFGGGFGGGGMGRGGGAGRG